MNKKDLLKTIENVKEDFKIWNDLKLREVEQGIITKEQYVEMLKVSKERLQRQIDHIEKEIEAMTMTIEVTQQEQLNEFADDEKANNGGGYDQKRVFFEVNGKKGVFEDTSCGDFGTRKFIVFHGKAALFGSMLNDEEGFSDFNGETIEEQKVIDHFNVPLEF